MGRAAHVREFSFRAGGVAAWSWDDALRVAGDAALAGAVFATPLFMGGWHPLGKLVYVLCAGAGAGAFCLRQALRREGAWRWSGAEWLIVAAIALLLLQLTPLSPGVLERVSPGVRELLPLWRADSDAPVRFGPWRTISLTPRETRAGLVLFLAHALVFLTVVQRVASRRDVERLLLWLALAAAGMAMLGLLQYFFSNGKFLWIYMHPSRDTRAVVRGTFSNQNHFAHFLALGLGPLLWLARRRLEERQAAGPAPASSDDWRRRAPLVLAVAGMTAVGFAGLLTFSRGGVIALGAATCVCLGIYAWKRLLGPRSVACLGAVGVAAALAILAYGYEPLTRRLGTLQESQSLAELSYARAKIWQAMLEGWANHRLVGAGVGSHAEVYPTYLEEHFEQEFTHGENGYLQVLLETGLAGAALLAAGIALGLYWAVQAVRRGEGPTVACAAPVLGGLAASVVHALGDFVWYLPGCMALTVILLACACRLHQIARQEAIPQAAEPSSRLPRPAWIGATALLLALAAAMVRDRLPPAQAAPHWEQYLALSLRSSGKSVWTSEGETIPADSPGLTARLIEHLDAALKRDPDDAVANLRMAVICLRMFDIAQQNGENAMGLTQIRDAALASQFASRQAQDQWLAAAVGEDRKYLDQAAWRLRRALRLCPLHGEAYVYLAETAFLDGLGPAAKHAYIAQAERLRPYDGVVLMAVGQEAALEGDFDRAMASWKRAFHQSPQSQQRVVELLAGGVSAEKFIEYFEPDQAGLGRLFARYRHLGRREDAVLAGRRYAAALQAEAQQRPPAVAARLWAVASGAYHYAGDREQALACVVRAVQAKPGDASLRRSFGFRLLEAERYDEAVDQFQWCLRHNPDDEPAKAGLARALRRGLTAPVAGPAEERAKRYY